MSDLFDDLVEWEYEWRKPTEGYTSWTKLSPAQIEAWLPNFLAGKQRRYEVRRRAVVVIKSEYEPVIPVEKEE
jgi:hypothetical protein